MSLPSLPALNRGLPVTSHSSRVHHVVKLVRTHADDPRLPVLLNALAGKSSYHALLAVEAARALGDEDRLRELAKHPSRRVRFRAAACLPLRVKDPQVFAADYAARPIGERRRLRRRIIDEGHHELAAALLAAPLPDRERAGLLIACDSEAVADHMPELGDLVPNLAALANRHPDALLAELRRRLEGAPADRRSAIWWWVAPAARHLARHRPRELALLLAGSEASQGLPPLFRGVAGTLLAAAPEEMARLLAATPDDWAQDGDALRNQVRRHFRELNREQRALILRAERDDDRRVAALLRGLPPGERALAFSDAYEGVELRDREWSEELLDALPRELRETEAARMAALPANQGRGDQLRLAACLALGDAITVAEPCLNSSDADERGAAWRAILASALRSRDPREVVVAFARIEALAGEQDPVRNAATSALAVASGRTLDLIPIERLKKLAGILTDARDTSSATFMNLQGALWRLLVHRAQQGEPVQEQVELLTRLPGSCAAPAVLAAGRVLGVGGKLLLPIPAAAAKTLAAGFSQTLRSEADRGEYDQVNCLAVLLGRDRHDLPEITGILRRAIRSHDPRTIDRAILVWLAPVRTRGERLAGLLKLDPSFATLGHVQADICRHRPDLATILYRKIPISGRLHDETPYIGVAPGPFDGWLPEQSRPYSQALARFVDDETQDRWQRLAAVEVLGRLPWLAPDALEPDSTETVIREAQLTAAFRSPAVEWSLTDFLTVLDTDLASAAMLAATRVVDELPPAETTKALMVVATDQWRKVNVRKQAVRQVARLHRPEAAEMLVDLAMDITVHRDVRLAATAGLIELLDDEWAWEALSEAAAGGREAARVLAGIDPGRMSARHRARFGEILAKTSPEPELVEALPKWVFWTPKITGRIVELLSSEEIPVRQAAVRALSGAGSGLRWGMLLVAVAGIAAAAADEPDDSMEELPNQRLLEDVVAALLPDSPRVRMERRARLKELAAALAAFPHTAWQHWQVLLAATDWNDPLTDLTELAEVVADPLRAREILELTRQTLKELHEARLCGDFAVATEELLARGDAVTGAIALALLGHAGDEVGWDDAWRSRLRTARSHPVPAVAAWAREIHVGSWTT
ncbi:hypothetical protein FBF34_14895 [Arachnia propionica]|uniref:HEAT repeat domain-containing protein n=1 Tax=Arachnia propionica TaxID=1750 RepID=A0AB37I473_9ACTN|nr:hypothetical protein [Arachnia propionica]QCT39126.1 hypothetical protein FBF34_14895 [Arachnia propionica]QUC11242.1 hypothetical protein J5A53_00595 [Arachnia propionica]RPA18094.1 hypothetical protein EGT56_09065 [Arachnia propionica]